MFVQEVLNPLSTVLSLHARIHAALEAMRAGIPVVLLDDFDRKNEADLIVAAERLTIET